MVSPVGAAGRGRSSIERPPAVGCYGVPPCAGPITLHLPSLRAVGEVVFNTSLTGYQEILTDPSYKGEAAAAAAAAAGAHASQRKHGWPLAGAHPC